MRFRHFRLSALALVIASLAPAALAQEPVAAGPGIAAEADAAAAGTPTSAPAPAPDAAAGAATVSAGLPDIDADPYFEGDTGGTFGKALSKALLPKSKRVAIAGFRVVFVNESAISAKVRASYLPGRDRTGAHAKMEVALSGVDNATLQALTDKAYATFLEQLRLAGREVLPAEEVKPLYAELKLAEASAEAPYRKTVDLGYGKRSAVAFAPTGLPLWWHNIDVPWGDAGFSQSNYRAFRAYSDTVKAIVIAPTFVVDFAQMQSSGNQSGLVAREASVGATLGISIGEMSMMGAYLEGRSGPEGLLRMKQGVSVDLPFAEMEVVEQKKTNGFLAVMTGSSKSRSSNVATTDNARYGAAAEAALTKATGLLAKYFQQHAG